MNDYATLTDARTIHITRLLPGPIERVWEYLVDGEKRSRWLAAGDIRPVVDSEIRLVFNNNTLSDPDDGPPAKYEKYGGETTMTGRVLEADPPHLLVFTWNEPTGGKSEVRIELQEREKQVHLSLTHSHIESREQLVGGSAGWHGHLDILKAVLEGTTPASFWRTHTALEEEYEERIPQ